MYEAYLVPISCEDFDILLVSSRTIFVSAGEEALQGHSKVLAILHTGAKRAILTRVKIYSLLSMESPLHGEEPRRMFMDVRMCECIVCMEEKPIK